MYERFTDEARKVMSEANGAALRLNHEYIQPAHILIGIMKESEGIGFKILDGSINLETLEKKVIECHTRSQDMVTMGKLPQALSAKNVVDKSIEYARSLNHNYVDTGHLLYAILAIEEEFNSDQGILHDLGFTRDGLDKKIRSIWDRLK